MNGSGQSAKGLHGTKRAALLLFTTAALGLLVAPAGADEYWIAYEGNDFPENEGWVRHASDPAAERWLEDGSLFIDSRADPHTTDNYTIYFDGGLDPEPGETFIMSWQLNVHEAVPWEDPGVYVVSDELWTVLFVFAEGYVSSTHEPNASAYFEPGVFHEFELRSGDMRSYELYIDDDLAIEGVFFEGFFSPCVGWGDVVHGGASLAQWDYFRFGVVPEGSAWLMSLILLVAFRRPRW
jgi:hypothetical protein